VDPYPAFNDVVDLYSTFNNVLDLWCQSVTFQRFHLVLKIRLAPLNVL
jgi:hypothetical protein